jgi:trehalose-6-phosphatase
MFLDYDGTLSPIVDDPDNALMSDDVRIAHNLLDVQHVLSFLSFTIWCLHL